MAIASEFLGITDAKTKLSWAVKCLEAGQDRFFVMRRNRPVAVMLSPGRYEELLNLEDEVDHLRDVVMVLRSRLEDDGTRHTLDEVLAKFEEA